METIPLMEHVTTKNTADMDRVDQEDWNFVCQRLASETGFTGMSEFHRFNLLYELDVLHDLVFDTMHTLLLGAVKRHLDYCKDKRYFSDPVIEERLKRIPWTAGM